MTRCGYCNTPADGTYLCRDCTGTLRTALERIADLWPDLTDAAGKRLNQTHSAHVSGTPETALPFNPRAADLQAQTAEAVNRLAHALTTRTKQTAPTGAIPVRAAWCAQRMFAARFIPSIGAHRGDIVYLARDVTAAVDKPNRRISIPKPCPDCGGPLESELRRPRVIICADCRAEHDAIKFLAAG